MSGILSENGLFRLLEFCRTLFRFSFCDFNFKHRIGAITEKAKHLIILGTLRGDASLVFRLRREWTSSSLSGQPSNRYLEQRYKKTAIAAMHGPQSLVRFGDKVQKKLNYRIGPKRSDLVIKLLLVLFGKCNTLLITKY